MFKETRRTCTTCIMDSSFLTSLFVWSRLSSRDTTSGDWFIPLQVCPIFWSSKSRILSIIAQSGNLSWRLHVVWQSCSCTGDKTPWIFVWSGPFCLGRGGCSHCGCLAPRCRRAGGKWKRCSAHNWWSQQWWVLFIALICSMIKPSKKLHMALSLKSLSPWLPYL